MPDFEELTFTRNGETLRGRMFRPTGRPRGGVVVVPSVHGCNDYIGEVAGMLATAGYAAMVYDLYSRGDHPDDLTSPEKIQAAVAALDDDRLTADIVAAGVRLREIADGNVGVLGFCIGGVFSLLAGCSDAFSGAVVYYGMLRYAPGIAESKDGAPIDHVENLRAPLLAHFGALDPWCPPEHIGELRSRLAAAGKVHEVYEYPGAGHAFHEFHRPAVYRPAAAADSWRRSLAFIDYYVAGEHS